MKRPEPLAELDLNAPKNPHPVHVAQAPPADPTATQAARGRAPLPCQRGTRIIDARDAIPHDPADAAL